MKKIQKWTQRQFLYDEELSKRFLKIQDSEDRKEEGESWSVEFIHVKSKIRLFDDETECVHWLNIFVEWYTVLKKTHVGAGHERTSLESRSDRKMFFEIDKLDVNVMYERIESSNLNEWESVDWKSYLGTMSSCQWYMRESADEHKCPRNDHSQIMTD